MNFIVQGCTDIGNVKSTNQDSFMLRVFTANSGKMAFAVLCDGMGGLAKGEVASASLVNAFRKWSEERLPVLCENGIQNADIYNDWCAIATEFNEKIKLYGKSSGVSMGTTVTAMLITESRYYIINVGDTRAYELYDGIRILTKDHSVVAREVELGNLTEEEAENDPRRSVLLQCIGASDVVYPDIFFGDTKKDAVYMLCSDGFRHLVSAEEIYANLNPSVMLNEDMMRNNMLGLIELNKQRQERDNITVLAVRTF